MARIVAQMASVKDEREGPDYDDGAVKPREKYRDRYEAMGDDGETLVPTTTTVPQKREYSVEDRPHVGCKMSESSSFFSNPSYQNIA